MQIKINKIIVFLGFLILVNFTTNCKKEDSPPPYNKYAIGNDYQGGKIAYVYQPGDPGYNMDTVHGIIAAPYDQGTFPWKPYSINNDFTNTISTLGEGKNNTLKLIAIFGTTNDYAAGVCYNLVLNGYDDWVLPSVDELKMLYKTDFKVFGFLYKNYWSSYKFNGTSAPSGMSFLLGSEIRSSSNSSYYVRAIRYF